MQFKRILFTGTIARSLCRSFVSAVNVNVNSLKSIRVIPKDVYEFSDSDEVKMTIFDSRKKEVDAKNVGSLRVVSTKDLFEITCSESQDISVLIEVPLSSSPEVDLEVKAESSFISVENLPAKNVDLCVGAGDISLNNIKGHLIRAETSTGNITTKGTLLAKLVQLTAKDGVSL